MKAHAPYLRVALLAALSIACEEDAPPSPLAESNSAAGSTIETFRVQARIYCPTSNPLCGHPNFDSLVNSYYLAINEMNLQYIPTGYSFRALPPIVSVDNRFASLSGPDGLADNGESNATLIAELAQLAFQEPDRITLFLIPGLARCWNGIPCPGSNDGFDDDDIIFCHPPEAGHEAGKGSTYAHEMGHYWCLRHSFSQSDPSGPGTLDYDTDDEVCDTLTNVHDTPGDPGPFEGHDTENWHEWCETTAHDADPASPHATYCTAECFQRIGDQLLPTNHHPQVRNAMSYHSFACRGPYLRNGTRYEAFTAGQINQIQECRAEVFMRLLLDDACAEDSDHDGVCDSIDLCPDLLDARNDDPDGDGRASPCDACPNDGSGYLNNQDGDLFCDENDVCPQHPDTNTLDSDGDGIWDACDLCPNDPDSSNLDTDGDGRGNACDSDDDGDGCSDRVDQHPLDDTSAVGIAIHVNCQDSSSTAYGSEAGDTDGDGLRDCRDTDDDNDGILDSNDSCPRTAGEMCLVPGGSCPLSPIHFTCRGGACNQQLLRVQELINPDPTRSFLYEIESVRGEILRVHPLQTHTFVDSLGGLRGTTRPSSGVRLRGALQMDIVDSRGRVLAELATYDGSAVQSTGTRGTRIDITIPSIATPVVTIRAIQ